MKVFFTTPFAGKKQYQSFIDEAIKAIESKGAVVISPEKSAQYKHATTKEKVEQFGTKEKSHYHFISQNIASADAVIFEASYEDFRVGHEATLGLMLDKPVLVLSQKLDYSHYIDHELLTGAQYSTIEEIKPLILAFIDKVKTQISQPSVQTLGDAVDLKHSATLSKLRYKATQGTSYVADWAQRASQEPDQVYRDIQSKLGHLKPQSPWDVFAKIYNEDTPDQVFTGVVRFIDSLNKRNHIRKTDHIVDVACGTGAVSRILNGFGYQQITAFDRSRAMLAEAFRLCSHFTNIKIIESDISQLKLTSPAKAMIWLDFSSNFALTENELLSKLNNLVANLENNGILILDVRTQSGWKVDFFKQKVTVYETDNFQRLWINLPDKGKKQITFDIYIRVKDQHGQWQSWEREQMTERMWRLEEVKHIIDKLEEIKIVNIYRDDFSFLSPTDPEPNLAYFVLRKISN